MGVLDFLGAVSLVGRLSPTLQEILVERGY